MINVALLCGSLAQAELPNRTSCLQEAAVAQKPELLASLKTCPVWSILKLNLEKKILHTADIRLFMTFQLTPCRLLPTCSISLDGESAASISCSDEQGNWLLAL